MIKMLQQEIFHPMLPWLWFCMKIKNITLLQMKCMATMLKQWSKRKTRSR